MRSPDGKAVFIENLQELRLLRLGLESNAWIPLLWRRDEFMRQVIKSPVLNDLVFISQPKFGCNFEHAIGER